MAKIQPAQILTLGTATELILKVLPFEMDATTAQFYYVLASEQDINGVISYNPLLDGNIFMTEQEFDNWGADNNYCIEWAANKLGLTLDIQ